MEEFDIIVVGAGPAGSTAAFLLAQAGVNVLLVERGQTPGSKNVSGGLIYTEILHQVYPEFWKKAPVERAISNHGLVFLSENSSLSLDLQGQTPTPSGLPANAFSVLRARFDPWLASQAEATGATLITGTTVDGLLLEDGKVIGIQAGPDPIGARVVINAEGSRSLLMKQAGLRTDFHADEVSIGVKEVIRLPVETINQRFRCASGQGAALTLVGQMNGLQGGGFIYTNRDTLSLGLVVKINSLYTSQRTPYDLLDEFKTHPFVAGIIEGGEVVEYSAQTVHRGGLHLISKLYGDGYVVVGSAARLLLNNILTLRGMDVAVASGLAAAQAVLAARERNDFTAAALSAYAENLKTTSVYKDMETFREVYSLLGNPRFFEVYPTLAVSVMEQLFAVHNTPGKKALGVAREHLGGKVSALDLGRDMLSIARGLVL